MKRQIKASVDFTNFESMFDYLESKLQSFGYVIDINADEESGIPDIFIENKDDSMPTVGCYVLPDDDGTFEFAFDMSFPDLKYNDLITYSDDFVYYLDKWRKVAKVLSEFLEY